MHKGTMRSLFVLVGLAGAAISSGAMAADISRPVYKAPPAGALPVTYDWTGFYIGGHVGYGWATEGLAGQLRPVQRVEHAERLPRRRTGRLQLSDRPVRARRGRRLLVDRHQWREHRARHRSASRRHLQYQCELDLDRTGRLGIAFDRWLVYGKGGVAWANDKF